jgi:hypothetical protein
MFWSRSPSLSLGNACWPATTRCFRLTPSFWCRISSRRLQLAAAPIAYVSGRSETNSQGYWYRVSNERNHCAVWSPLIERWSWVKGEKRCLRSHEGNWLDMGLYPLLYRWFCLNLSKSSFSCRYSFRPRRRTTVHSSPSPPVCGALPKALPPKHRSLPNGNVDAGALGKP